MALSNELDRILAGALADELARVEADERAADGAGGPWSWAIGAGSAVDAVKASAAASRRLYAAHLARAARVRASGSIAELDALLRDLGFVNALPQTVATSARDLTAREGVKVVAVATAKDAAKGAQVVAGAVASTVRWGAVVVPLALVAFLAWRFGGRRS